jgi:tRNA 5-methylaminomethyl-2-thiouridine biosynthesis bifunctional protein
MLAGCGLPQAWSDAPTWTVLDLDFDDGAVFLVTMQAWLDAPRRPARLRYAALLPAPLTSESLRIRALRDGRSTALLEALLARWPMPLAGVHRIELESGRVQLTLAIGDAAAMLPGLVPVCDSLFVVRPFATALPAPDGTPDSERPVAALLRRACATLQARGLASAEAGDARLARALEDAGMTLETVTTEDGERVLRARRRTAPPAGTPLILSASLERRALIVGAGLAGCAVAYALARRGWRVVRLDGRHDGALSGSLQPVLAHHPSVTPDDAPLSRLTRAALLLSRGAYDVGATRWIGRLQQCSPERARAASADMPAEWVQALDMQQASARAGLPLREGGLWLPAAGSADPLALCAGWTIDGVTVLEPAAVARLERTSEGWRAIDADGCLLAEAPVAIVATGHGSLTIDLGAGHDPFPIDGQLGPAGLQRLFGGTTIASPGPDALPACVLGGVDGHAIPLGDGRLLLGPTTPEVDDPQERAHRAWARFASRLAAPEFPPGAPPDAPASSRRTTAVSPAAPPRLVPGCEGMRLSVRDHLPVAGPVPDATAIARDAARLRADDRRALPTLPGLWIVAAFGGRGLLWSVLCAELLASRLDAEPAPLERPLADALDPGRFIRRALRRPDSPG